MAAAPLGSYIRGVVMPLVELPRGCSSTRQIRSRCQQLHRGEAQGLG